MVQFLKVRIQAGRVKKQHARETHDTMKRRSRKKKNHERLRQSEGGRSAKAVSAAAHVARCRLRM